MTVAKGKNLVRVLAHDLANPLTVLDFRVKRLLKTPDAKPELIEAAEKMQIAVQHMIEIIENVRGVEAASSNRWPIHVKAFSLADVVKSLADDFDLRLKEKTLSFSYKIEDFEPYQLTSDPDTLRTRVLGPIISNAIKYSNVGGKIEFSVDEVPGGISFCIRDYGVGMDSETLEKALADDFRIVHEGTAGEKGSGLGLLLAKNFAFALKSKVELYSQTEQGTLVRVSIPKHLDV